MYTERPSSCHMLHLLHGFIATLIQVTVLLPLVRVLSQILYLYKKTWFEKSSTTSEEDAHSEVSDKILDTASFWTQNLGRPSSHIQHLYHQLKNLIFATLNWKIMWLETLLMEIDCCLLHENRHLLKIHHACDAVLQNYLVTVFHFTSQIPGVFPQHLLGIYPVFPNYFNTYQTVY